MSYVSKVTDAIDAEEPEQPKVLVVEDEHMVADLYWQWLDQAGFDAEVGLGGREGLKKIDKDIDVVLLDRRMPEIPGDQVLDVIRSDDIYQMTPRRFKGNEPYGGATEDDWDKDISLETTRKLDPDIVENIQSKEIEARVCMITAVKPSMDIVDLEFDHYIVKDIQRDQVIEIVNELAHLDRFTEEQRRYQALRWKKHLLEERFTDQQLEDDDRYHELIEVMREIEDDGGEEIRKLKEIPFV